MLEPSKQYINWFYEEDKKGNLLITPKYQRNPIWSVAQKCFLIDSILSDVPIPPIYLNVVSQKVGTSRRTLYEVVDGQQRLRAILEFLNNEYALDEHTAKMYKVSLPFTKLIGKKYSQLPEDQQDKVWNFPLAVQELRDYGEAEIRDTFRRLNSVVERLNKQELRHSQFFGEFAKLVAELTIHLFWIKSKVVSRGDVRRMRDAEFISELVVLLLDGIQDGQKSLDRFYAAYDATFPQKHKTKVAFLSMLQLLEPLVPVIQATRFRKRADFYALFASLVLSKTEELDAKQIGSKLEGLSKSLEKAPEELRGRSARYYSTVIEGPNKLSKRKERTLLLQELLGYLLVHNCAAMPSNPKPTPRAVVEEFIASVNVLEDGFDGLLAALSAAPKSAKNAKVSNVVAEQFATSAAILWENFLHEVLVAYVLRNHKKYLARLEKRISDSVTDKFGAHCGKKLVFVFGTPGLGG